MKVFALGNNLLITGMRLAGIPGEVVDDGAVLQKTIEEIASKNEFGIIFIGMTVAVKARAYINEYRAKYVLPVLLEVPDGETGRDANYLTKFLNESLGVSL